MNIIRNIISEKTKLRYIHFLLKNTWGVINNERGGCSDHWLFRLGEVSWEELGHTESPDTFGAENLGHLLVWGEVLLVFGVLEVVLLQVGPQELDAFRSGSFLLSDNVSQICWQLHGLGESLSFWHGEDSLRSGIKMKKRNIWKNYRINVTGVTFRRWAGPLAISALRYWVDKVDFDPSLLIK